MMHEKKKFESKPLPMKSITTLIELANHTNGIHVTDVNEKPPTRYAVPRYQMEYTLSSAMHEAILKNMSCGPNLIVVGTLLRIEDLAMKFSARIYTGETKQADRELLAGKFLLGETNVIASRSLAGCVFNKGRFHDALPTVHYFSIYTMPKELASNIANLGLRTHFYKHSSSCPLEEACIKRSIATITYFNKIFSERKCREVLK